MQSFLLSCKETKAQLQAQLAGLNTVDVGCSSFTLLAEEGNQAQTLRDIQTLEAKIAYLKSVAKMYGSDFDSVETSVIFALKEVTKRRKEGNVIGQGYVVICLPY